MLNPQGEWGFENPRIKKTDKNNKSLGTISEEEDILGYFNS